MPAWGLIHDSPVFYYAGKALRTKHSSRGGGSRANISLSFHFQGVILYKPILNFELNNPAGMVGIHLHGIGREIERGAKRQVGVQTGALRKSIHIMRHVGHAKGQTIEIGSNLKYALMHHEGTKPHIITPNPPNKVLSFSRGSRVVHTKVVHHPGTKANRYLSDQLRVHVR
jgi:hypothetical protein